MTKEEIQTIIQQHIENSNVFISGEDGKYKGVIVSDYFAPLDKLSRHQAVYSAIKKYILNGEIHALSIATYTCSEYQETEKK